MRALTVLATGPLALIQDLGRPGNAHLGVPPSGALDQPSLRLANRLVGNPESAAGIETLLGGLSVRAEASCTVAVTGPQVSVSVSGRAAGSHHPVHLAAGDELVIGTPAAGLRCYVGVSGGVDVPEQLGSRATDVLSGIGPEPLRKGDVLPLGTPGLPVGVDEIAPARTPDDLVIPVVLGPREDWFTDPGTQIASGQWKVSPESNRVGVRLVGTALRRCERFQDVELASEGLVTGAIQVRPNGLPVIFLADHPTTGGYPVIGVIGSGSLPSLAQARPGVRVRFRPTA
ncbi:biotin-dependent carboxyltransferase family protein [Kibdelosporangium persicum]|uniref:Biotin-dependent carboxyltransferase n=1 Tax=Kibdelosporangium persicum TaxID=2698649 RepID=A0ABX2EXJ3_9PSEU|nr:biotin-dependent carboxyltransferase family protein [Kibdelosporangium persicum]NRN63708.1 Biotin-dependent carboxyltransferase [Kibdelosporangium persicum]